MRTEAACSSISNVSAKTAGGGSPRSPRFPAFLRTSLVSRDPEIMSGALRFTGTRVPVKSLFEYLEGTSSFEEFLEDFPSERWAGLASRTGNS